MTQAEQRGLNEIRGLVNRLSEENRKFREDVNNLVNGLVTKVEQKHLPLSLEQEVVNAVHASVSKAFTEALTGYNSPLTKYAQNVVTRYQQVIESVFDSVVQEAIQTDEFRQRVREVLLSKIAKTMISGIDGSIDKTINLMKQDAVFRSRLTLSVNSLVDEFLNQKK